MCDLHGGKSTGPKTAEGKARVVAAMQAGRRRRIAELAAEGKTIRTGRRLSRPKLSPEELGIANLIGQLGDERRAAAALERPPRRKRGRPTKEEQLAQLKERLSLRLRPGASDRSYWPD